MKAKHTVKSNDTEDEDQGENKNNNGINLQAGRLVGVKTCVKSAKYSTDHRSYRSPCHTTKARGNIRSMVLLEPPAPAARVLLGRTLAIFSFWSAAARRRIAVRGPPGIEGDEGRPTLAPLAAAPAIGEAGRGEDYPIHVS
jgi:hypothetical protein